MISCDFWRSKSESKVGHNVRVLKFEVLTRIWRFVLLAMWENFKLHNLARSWLEFISVFDSKNLVLVILAREYTQHAPVPCLKRS